MPVIYLHKQGHMAIIALSADTPETRVAAVRQALENSGCPAAPMVWRGRQLVILVNPPPPETLLAHLQPLGSSTVLELTKEYPLVSREVEAQGLSVPVGGTVFGGGQIQVIAGPCAVESDKQIRIVARAVKDAGCGLLRGGAYKPRTSPYAFQGHGQHGLQLLARAAGQAGLPYVTELMDVRELERFLDAGVDAIQIGARNMQNFDLLKAVGRCNTPIILKRGMSATVSEWFTAAEYIASGGNHNIILCERGIRTFETAYRNVLDISAVITAKKETCLPVIVDPSHASGQARMVLPLALAAVAAGADGLMVEVHPDPARAWSDAGQALTLRELHDFMASITGFAAAFRNM